ncbi:zinc finger protein ZOP1 [Cornus florida]|uniref:zinc finger protein ZOP1 n=1 Tax=Cornus florida TaxID=4283 RepID=UPI00289796CD|nr:zinc finger protein ZOP1 [Cornus florida]
MTEYWVSQGNKWCDFCKIFISNNPSSIRNHELGQRHKDSVSKRLTTMRQEKAEKAKKESEAARALEQIEAKAKRSYQKDMATFKESRDSNAHALVAQENGQGTSKGSTIPGGEWEHDDTSGYYYNQSNGCYYDPNSGFYYTDALGKWVTQEEAIAASRVSSKSMQGKTSFKKPSSGPGPALETKSDAKCQSGPPPGRVVSASPNPMRSVKGAPSSLAVNKRKRQDVKPKALSEEESAALKARDAARKRVEEREKPLLGLYRGL